MASRCLICTDIPSQSGYDPGKTKKRRLLAGASINAEIFNDKKAQKR